MIRQIETRDGCVCARPGERFGYFGWPSVCRMRDGRLVAVASGLRYQHVCPWGKTVLMESFDEGNTWTEPVVVNDSPLDDRDAGIIELSNGDWMLNWFTTDTRMYMDSMLKWPDENAVRWMRAKTGAWTDEMAGAQQGSWTRVSHDQGKTWDAPVRCPVSSPHGGALLPDGSVLYVGKRFPLEMKHYDLCPVAAALSGDGGKSWREIGVIPEIPDVSVSELHEPHIAVLPNGDVVCAIRGHKPYFCVYQSVSRDGGRTWSVPELLPAKGSPPHLLRHSSGALVCVYGYRLEPYGQRAIISLDGGKHWSEEYVLRDDGPTGDLGYPCSCELGDGSIFTVFYQQPRAGEKPALLSSRWKLPTY